MRKYLLHTTLQVPMHTTLQLGLIINPENSDQFWKVKVILTLNVLLGLGSSNHIHYNPKQNLFTHRPPCVGRNKLRYIPQTRIHKQVKSIKC